MTRSAARKGLRVPLGERLKMRLEHVADVRSSRVAAWLIRATGGRVGRLWRRRVLALTTLGRRTGRKRTVPLQYFPDGEAFVVVAANSGLSRPPGWYFNLTAAGRATIDVEGRRLEVRAEELSDEEASAFWPRLLEAAPDYERYRRRTSRRISLVRLVPAGPSPAGHGSDTLRGGRRDRGQDRCAQG